ncbi:MAG: hypothetical protein QXG09_02555 [Candidatus Bathyarchaeia archaeon]
MVALVLLMAVGVAFAAYSYFYTWTKYYRINPLTSFEKIRIPKTTGGTIGIVFNYTDEEIGGVARGLGRFEVKNVKVNVDIDTKNQFILLKTYFNMARLCKYVEVFETTNGYYVIGYDFPDMTKEQFYEFRRAMGDDPVRVWLDETCHGKPEQSCFRGEFTWMTVNLEYGRGCGPCFGSLGAVNFQRKNRI